MDKFEKNELFDSLSKSEVYSKNEFYNSDEGSVVSMKHQL